MRSAAVAFAALATALVGPEGLPATEISARQGTEEDRPVTEFASPMVLEVPLTGFDELTENRGRSFSGLRRYVCDDVSILSLTAKKSARPRSPHVRIDLEGALYVRPSFDRLVDVRFGLIADGAEVASAVQRRIDAEEGKTRPLRAVLTIPAEDFAAMFAGESEPLLRITVGVEPND